MQLSSHNINNRGKLQHLQAEDLFSYDLIQVFDAKTGKYIGYYRLNGEINISEDQPEEIVLEEQKENKYQLQLF